MRPSIDELRQHLTDLFASDPEAALRLRYVINNASEYGDPVASYPERVYPKKLEVAVANIRSDRAVYEARLAAASTVLPADAFLMVCNAICAWAVLVEAAYSKRLAKAETGEAKRRADRSAHVQRLSGPLSGAVKAADYMLVRRWCEASDAGP